MSDILVVSNTSAHRRTWKYLFSGYGHQVHVIADLQGLEELENPPKAPFFIIVDAEGRNGAEEGHSLVSNMRALYANSIIIAVIGWGQLRTGLIEAGADGCISRPVDATLVLKLISNTAYSEQLHMQRPIRHAYQPGGHVS